MLEIDRLFRRLIPLAQAPRFARMPVPAQHFFCAFEWLGETSNGGLAQYFASAAGDRWRTAAVALDALAVHGDADGARAFRSALACFPNGAPPADRFERSDAIPAFDDALAGVIEAARAGTFAALARFVVDAPDAATLRFIDGYPSGLKALDLPADLTMADVRAHDDAWFVVTGAFHVAAHTPVASSEWRTFHDAFAILDEVSAGGFPDYLRTGAAARWRDSVAALTAIGAPEHAALVSSAAALRDAGGAWQDAVAPLGAEHQQRRTALAEALAHHVRSRLG